MKIEIDLNEREWALAYDALSLGVFRTERAWKRKDFHPNPYGEAGRKLMAAIGEGLRAAGVDLEEILHKEILDRYAELKE